MTDDSKEEEASSHCSVSAVSVIFGDREGGFLFFSLRFRCWFNFHVLGVWTTPLSSGKSHWPFAGKKEAI